MVLVPVPGEVLQTEAFPRVILYEEMGEHLPVTSILDILGYASEGEFHAIRFAEKAVFEEIPMCRDEVLRGLEMCMGDSLAAEVVLCVLMAKIHQRDNMIGAFSVNFTRVDRRTAGVICRSLKTLIRTVVLELSLELLNGKELTPKKNEENEKLSVSPLQIPNGSLLIIDESSLNPGELTGKGIENVNILIQLIQAQQVTYDFGYTKLNFPTDLKIIVLSQGKSLLKLPLDISLQASSEEFTFPQENRMYIDACNQVTANLPESITKSAQEYFVLKRKEKKITIEDFHLLLTLTRYISQSHGESIALQRHWDHAVNIFTQLSSRSTH